MARGVGGSVGGIGPILEFDSVTGESRECGEPEAFLPISHGRNCGLEFRIRLLFVQRSRKKTEAHREKLASE